MFNVESFQNTQFDQPMDTKYEPVPSGEYNALLEDFEVNVLQDGKVPMNVRWAIEDTKLKASMGRDKITVRQTIWLDTTPSGSLDLGKGKNVGLGRLREALDQNAPGRAWQPSMLKGQVARIKVTQTPAKDGTGDIYNNVTGVAAIA